MKDTILTNIVTYIVHTMMLSYTLLLPELITREHAMVNTPLWTGWAFSMSHKLVTNSVVALPIDSNDHHYYTAVVKSLQNGEYIINVLLLY